MIISNISVPLLGLVDTAILGHLDSPAYLSAVAIGVSLLSFLYWGFAFLRMGTTGLAAQYYGAQNFNRVKQVLLQSALLGCVIGLCLIGLSHWLIPLGLQLMAPPEGSYTLSQQYVSIRILSAPAVLITFAVIGCLIGQQNTRLPLLIVVATNALNILLDFFLIIGLGMNSAGAAWATVIAEYSGCALGLLLLYRLWRHQPGHMHWQNLKRWQDYRHLLAVNRQLFVRTLLLLSSIAFFTAQGARQGEITLAANAVLFNLLLLMAYGLDGIANAAEALVGESVGQRRLRKLLQVSAHCAIWSAAIALVFSLVFMVAEVPFVSLLTSIPEVQSAAYDYYDWLIALPLIAVWAYLLDGIFIGAARSDAMQNSMLLCSLGIYLPCWYFTQGMGNHGLWLAFSLLNLSRALSMGAYFWHFSRRNRWW